MMATHLFLIESRLVCNKTWGDYGGILHNGMAHRPKHSAFLALKRTGPFVPPIICPGIGHVILTSEARRLLETSGLTGFAFNPVEKTLIVELHCEKWDLNAEEPH